MTKEELIKELEELRDIKNYSQSELLNTGYKTAILDALDLVNKYFDLAINAGMKKELDDTIELQHGAKKHVNISTSAKELLECTVCWGGGKIEIDDYGNEEDCTWCNGTGLVNRNL